MKKFLFISLAVMMLASLFLTGCGGDDKPAEKVVLRVNVTHPSTDPVGVYTVKAAEAFNAQFEGEYEVTVHTGGTLLSMPESLDGVRTGAVEMGQFPPGVFSNTDVRLASAEMPFLFNNIQANIAACPEFFELYDEIMQEKYNQKGICIWTATSLDVISKRPLKTLADWKGLQAQAINPPTAAAINALGGAAVSIDFPDAYSSLSKGVVDAGLYATTQMIEYSMWEVADFCVPVYMVPTFMFMTINLDVWNDLPSNVQDALLEAFQTELADGLNTLYENTAESNLETLTSKGVEIYILPEAEREIWRQAIQPWVDEQFTAMGDFANTILDIAERINAEYPYVGYID